MNATQASLGLQVSHRTVLVTLDMVRAFLGVDAESVLARIESGEILWAWDIACHGGERSVCEYRIWLSEFLAPSIVHGLAREQVLDAVIGTRLPRLRRTELTRLLLCSRPHVHRLIQRGELMADPARPENYVTRESLRRFLERRLIA